MGFLEFERRFRKASWTVTDTLRKFHLPSYVRNEVLMKFRKAMKRGLLKGKAIEQVAACLLYYVVKRDDLPLTAFGIAEEFEFGKHEMLQTYFRLRDKLNLERQRFDPSSLVEKYAFELELEPKEAFEARKFVDELDKVYADPRTKVACALYKVSNRTQEEIAEALEISTRTIIRLRKKARKKLGEKVFNSYTEVDRAVGFKGFRSGSPIPA